MQRNRISDICYAFLQNHEYDDKFKNVDFDISWSEEKLEYSDILKLKEMITDYSLQIYQTTFECGFTYAWQLFHECQEKNLQNKP